jgi:hypothetical protein
MAKPRSRRPPSSPSSPTGRPTSSPAARPPTRPPSRSEADLAALAACRADPTSAESARVLGEALAQGGSFAVAAAARLVGENELEPLASRLAPAYARVAERDPGCHAKLAVVEALCRLGRDERDTFLHGARCRQLEAAWGPPVDTAAALRGHAALGLANGAHPDAAAVIAELLADPEWVTRAGAARAAAALDPDVAVPLLVLKASAGDPQPEVLGDCLRGLLAAAGARALPWVVARLDADEAVAEQAALALGESRLEPAFAPLRELAEHASGDRRRVALLALALLRQDAALAYLLGLVREAARATAAAALEALAIHKHDDRVADAARAAARAHGDPALVAQAEAAFGPAR